MNIDRDTVYIYIQYIVVLYIAIHVFLMCIYIYMYMYMMPGTVRESIGIYSHYCIILTRMQKLWMEEILHQLVDGLSESRLSHCL